MFFRLFVWFVYSCLIYAYEPFTVLYIYLNINLSIFFSIMPIVSPNVFIVNEIIYLPHQNGSN